VKVGVIVHYNPAEALDLLDLHRVHWNGADSALDLCQSIGVEDAGRVLYGECWVGPQHAKAVDESNLDGVTRAITFFAAK
jgi:hypothetical protein